MSTQNPARKSMLLLVLFFVVFATFALLACDDGPSPDNAYGITSPVTEIENAVINAVDSNPCDNALSRPSTCP